jgi:hypothetical protein
MKQMTLRSAVFGALLILTITASAQEKGYWRASNSSAKSITGDIGLSDARISINFLNFPIALIRALQPGEVSAVFDVDSNAVVGEANLYRLTIPGDRKFLHKNSLCGSDDTHWMVTYAAGRSLQLAFFSGEKPPALTVESISNSTDLCGVFSYER